MRGKYWRHLSLLLILFVFIVFEVQISNAKYLPHMDIKKLFDESPIIVLATIEKRHNVGSAEINMPYSFHKIGVTKYKSELIIHHVYKGSANTGVYMVDYNNVNEMYMSLTEGTYILFLKWDGDLLVPAHPYDYSRDVSPSIIGSPSADSFEKAIAFCLEDKNPYIVAKAVEDIVVLKGKLSEDDILPLLNSKNASIKGSVLLALVKLDDNKHLNEVDEYAQGANNAEVRNEVRNYVVRMGFALLSKDEKSLPYLTKLANGKSKHLRKAALYALSIIGAADSTTLLIGCLKKNESDFNTPGFLPGDMKNDCMRGLKKATKLDDKKTPEDWNRWWDKEGKKKYDKR